MPIPPLYQRILHTCIYIITLPKAYWELNGVYNMQNSHGHKSSDVEPNCHIHVTFSTLDDRAKHIYAKHNPNDSNSDINRPLHLSIFVGGRQTQWQSNGRSNNNQLPYPKVNLAQQIAEHPRFQYPLHRIVNTHKDGISHESKDDRVCMHRTNPSKCGVLRQKVHLRPD